MSETVLTTEQERLLNYLNKILLEIRTAVLNEDLPREQRELLATRRDTILFEYGL